MTDHNFCEHFNCWSYMLRSSPCNRNNCRVSTSYGLTRFSCIDLPPTMPVDSYIIDVQRSTSLIKLFCNSHSTIFFNNAPYLPVRHDYGYRQGAVLSDSPKSRRHTAIPSYQLFFKMKTLYLPVVASKTCHASGRFHHDFAPWYFWTRTLRTSHRCPFIASVAPSLTSKYLQDMDSFLRGSGRDAHSELNV